MASDDCFRTPVSSEDLITFTPERIPLEDPDVKNDFLTDTRRDVPQGVCEAFHDSSKLNHRIQCTESKEIASNSMLTDGAGHSLHTSSAGSVTFKCEEEEETSTAPTPALVRSVSAILTPTQVGPEKLINLSGCTPPMAVPHTSHFEYNAAQDFNHVQSLQVILQDQGRELSYLKHENKELRYLIQKGTEFQEKLTNKIKKLEGDVQNLSQNEQKLIQQVSDKALINKKMANVMVEYEKTITGLIKKQENLVAEKEEAVNHLADLESSFNDLLSKYEKSVIHDLKDEQKVMHQKLVEQESVIKKYEDMYNKLKKKANETLEQFKKAHNIEVTKLNANIQELEITVSSLQENLSQKKREVEKLATYCDRLINSNQSPRM